MELCPKDYPLAKITPHLKTGHVIQQEIVSQNLLSWLWWKLHGPSLFGSSQFLAALQMKWSLHSFIHETHGHCSWKMGSLGNRWNLNVTQLGTHQFERGSCDLQCFIPKIRERKDITIANGRIILSTIFVDLTFVQKQFMHSNICVCV